MASRGDKWRVKAKDGYAQEVMANRDESWRVGVKSWRVGAKDDESGRRMASRTKDGELGQRMASRSEG